MGLLIVDSLYPQFLPFQHFLLPHTLHPLTKDFIKLNFDNTLKGNLGQASYGGNFRKANEHILHVYVGANGHRPQNE